MMQPEPVRSPLPPPPDLRVAAEVRAAQHGDRAACSSLFTRHQGAVMAYCLLASKGDRAQAMDLAQDVFGQAFRCLPSLSDPARFKGWLFTIAANHCRNKGQAEARRRALLEGVALELGEGLAAPEELPQDRERRIARVRELIEAVADSGLKEIVRAHYVEGEATRAIAERLSVPHGTVTVKLMRFRERIKRELCAAIASGEFP